MATTPYILKTSSEVYFDVIDALCSRFMALNPLEILNADMGAVFDIYVNCILHDKKEKAQSNSNTWVTSNNATWH